MRALHLAHAWDGWPRHPLLTDECEAICVAVHSTFRKLGNFFREVAPIYRKYGLKAPSAGTAARNLSEEIEVAIAQHCPAFQKPPTHHDLERCGEKWEVKICQDSGLTINQSATIRGEHYIVVNYAKATVVPTRIWVLWESQSEWFSPRVANANARHIRFRDTPPQARQQLYRLARQRAQDQWLPLPK